MRTLFFLLCSLALSISTSVSLTLFDYDTTVTAALPRCAQTFAMRREGGFEGSISAGRGQATGIYQYQGLYTSGSCFIIGCGVLQSTYYVVLTTSRSLCSLLFQSVQLLILSDFSRYPRGPLENASRIRLQGLSRTSARCMLRRQRGICTIQGLPFTRLYNLFAQVNTCTCARCRWSKSHICFTHI